MAKSSTSGYIGVMKLPANNNAKALCDPAANIKKAE
jgi:hypothetical protein